MIDALKPYRKYKDSDSPWLGKVPEHWGVRRLKYVLRERDVRSADGTEQLLRVSQFTGVTERKRADGGDEPDTRAESLVGYKTVKPNDLVVNIMLAWNGSMGVSVFAGIVSPAYCVYRFGVEARPWYFHHLLRSPAYKARIKAVSTGVVESRLRLYTDDLYRLEGLLPPPAEQSAIMRFLDYMDRRIRRYIRAKQKLIKLLEEQKQAIIHRAVTRGLDPNVRLKPSGVEWLGDVPEHWIVKPLKRWARINAHVLGEKTNPQYEFRYVDIGSVGTGRLTKKPESLQFAASPSRARRILNKGDTIISTVRTYLKAIWYVDANSEDLVASTGFAVLTPREEIVPELLGYVMQNPSFLSQVTANSVGIAYPAIAESSLGRFHVPMPPTVNEQKAIVDHIRSQTSSLDELARKELRGIDLLREFRTRLIADVVTGKLDVREAAANMPDEEEKLDTSDEAEIAAEIEGLTDGDEVASEESEA